MTVEQLIKKLSEFPADFETGFYSDELGGWTPIKDVIPMYGDMVIAVDWEGKKCK